MKFTLQILMTALLLLLGGSPMARSEMTPKGTPSEFVRAEHDQIYATLGRLEKTPGKTGKAAKKLFIIMRPHLFKEESFVLPQLGALKDLAFGKTQDPNVWIIQRSEKLKEEYPQMVAEHKAILKAIDALMRAAELDGEQSAIVFAFHLRAHVRHEDDIIYPAAILAGEYIKKAGLSKHPSNPAVTSAG